MSAHSEAQRVSKGIDMRPACLSISNRMSHESNASKIRYSVHIQHSQALQSWDGMKIQKMLLNKVLTDSDVLHTATCARWICQISPTAFTLMTGCSTAAPFGGQEQKQIETDETVTVL